MLEKLQMEKKKPNEEYKSNDFRGDFSKEADLRFTQA